jgi:hypothetical protein
MEAGLWELLATDAVRERVAASGLVADLEPLDDGDTCPWPWTPPVPAVPTVDRW